MKINLSNKQQFVAARLSRMQNKAAYNQLLEAAKSGNKKLMKNTTKAATKILKNQTKAMKAMKKTGASPEFKARENTIRTLGTEAITGLTSTGLTGTAANALITGNSTNNTRIDQPKEENGTETPELEDGYVN